MKLDPSELDPGIKNVVMWLRSLGYNTTDSGDGKTKIEQGLTIEDGVLDHPHVFIQLDPYQGRYLCSTCDILSRQIKKRIGSEKYKEKGVWVEGNYTPANQLSIIAVYYLDDELLGEESE